MADWLLGLGGAFLIAFVMVDVLWSTLSASGGGPLTDWVSGHLWRQARRVHRRVQNHGLLQAAGVAVLLVIVALWIGLVFLGWFLVFSIEPTAIVESDTQMTATVADRIYYLGFAFFSLGVGDFIATDPLWRILTVVACANGLTLVTLSITYLVPVVTAVTSKRQLAETITSIGPDPAGIVEESWNGHDFAALEDTLFQLNSLISQIAERHLAYPVLHFYHAPKVSSSVAVALAQLDEAITLLEVAVDDEAQPDRRILRSSRHAIDLYMRRIPDSVADPPDEVPSLPGIERLESSDVPMKSTEQIVRGFDALGEHRAKLRAMVHVDGWRWHEAICVDEDER